MTERSVLDDATAEHWQMVTDNTGLVWYYIRRAKILDVHADDAYQDGCLGLLRAAMLFDEARGFTFSTYAMPWIRQAIERGRGRLEGCNYRRAADARRGAEWSAPLSLDVEYEGDSMSTFALVDHADPADAGVLAATMDEAARRMLRACRDVLDVDIVATMMDDDGPGAMSALARRHKITREAVRRRKVRLQGLARPHFEEAA